MSRRVGIVRKAFLSSTGADLHEYREKVYEALQALDDWKCIRMEDFGARDREVDTFCREMVLGCDLFIGLIGHRFGDGPADSGESYTQREYRAAREAGKPRLLFIAPNDFSIPADRWEDDRRIGDQARFRNALLKSGERIAGRDFRNPGELAHMVVTAIYHWDRPTVDPTRYLTELRKETAYIDIKRIQVGQKEAYRFRIDQLYTPLTTVLAPEPEARREKGREMEELRGQRVVPLQKTLQRMTRLVLVGDPGSGKTTFLRRIAFAVCETLLGSNPGAAQEMLGRPECPFPVLLAVSSLASFIEGRIENPVAGQPADADSPEWLFHYLESEKPDWELSGEYLRQKLRHESSLLLFDGLDEAPSRVRRKSVAKLVGRIAETYRKAQVVVSSRPPAYGGEAVIPDFDTVRIRDLEPAAVAAFAANWCGALYSGDAVAASRQQRALEAEIGSRPEIRRMAVNPVMLTALAVLHYNEKHLPEQRAELYEAVLTWLARAREDKQKRVRADVCLDLMQDLAYAMHAGAAEQTVEIAPHAAARALAPSFREAPQEKRLAMAERFLDEEEIDSGIIVRLGEVLRFWHLTFQEYLAAKALAAKEQDRRKLLFKEGRLYRPKWRETVLLLAGVLRKQGVDRVDEFLKETLDQLDDGTALEQRARCVGMIGAILEDLRAWKYQIEDDRYQENLTQVLAIFDREAAETIGFEIRLAAAQALGQAGDPRLKADNWVPVPKTTFWMGAQKDDPAGRNYDPEAYGDESPVHQVTVSAFQIGRYPVTVEEYARFLEHGGTEKGSEPENWQEQLRYPNCPVVGVSWFDASAYCSWVGGRLPTEAEWECAARSGREGVRYPWGDEKPDPQRANFDGGPGRTTPVGLYPVGATPSGIHDLAGNVDEWVADWYLERYGEGSPVTDPKGPESGEARVLRGGSWYIHSTCLLASVRVWYHPAVGVIDFGFRCAREVFP